MPDYNRNALTDFGGLNPPDFEAEVAASTIGPNMTAIVVTGKKGDEVTMTFDATLSAAEETELDSLASAHGLNKVKHSRASAIDRRTKELIDAGFTYDSENFSLSLTAQSKMIGAHQIKDHPAMIFPIKWNSKDDLATRSLADASELDTFYLTAVGTLRAIVDSGTALKDQVRDATTVAEVNAVEDTR